MDQKKFMRPFQVMAKPIGPACNLNCTYCYYLEKNKLYPDTSSALIRDDLLEIYVRDYIASQVNLNAPEIVFSWQGGEPTLCGLDFFKRVLELQKLYSPKDRVITNALQTNGTLLTRDWCAFFKKNNFLIGLSIDGPQRLHDYYRLDGQKKGSYDKVARAVELLREEEVDFNVLTVINNKNVREPSVVYRFLKEIGAQYIQFIPIVERTTDGVNLSEAPQSRNSARINKVTPWSVGPEDYGNFLCKVFDEWVAEDIGKIFIQFFDVQLELWAGRPSSLCLFSETCGQGLILERNGDLYSCDHYVYPEYLLGNIMQTPLEDLASSPFQLKFGQEKKDSLPQQCRNCDYLFACHGGCPKHRFLLISPAHPRPSLYAQNCVHRCT